MTTTTDSLIDTAIREKYINFIDSDKIKIGEKLWVGAFSEVYQAKLGEGEYTSVTVAAKFLRTFKEDTVDEKTRDEFIKELKQLRNVECHPNILDFCGISKGKDPYPERYILIVEYADCGTLKSYLAKNFSELTDEHKLQLAIEIAEGVKYLHDENIVHGDLNPTNILVDQDHIKIGDLGLSKRVNMEIAHSSSTLRAQLQYIDPLYYIVDGYIRNKKSDIYSIGVLFWELTSGKVAFEKFREATIGAVINGEREAPIEGTPQPFIDLYTNCWDLIPARRPEIDEVCETLDGINWSSSDISSEATDTETVVGDVVSKEDGEDIKLLDGATEILKRGLDSGEEFITISTVQIATYLKENNKGQKGLAYMLVGEEDPEKNVFDNPYDLLLGFSYYEGFGLDSNLKLAFKAFQVAAKRGDSYAEFLLAFCHHNGYGTKLSKKSAFKWYERSAKNGNPSGQYGLANCYKDGDGTPKDLGKAFEWYKKSAEGGSRLGQYWLANAYRTGSGTRRNTKEAGRLYRMSADKGFWRAGEQLKKLKV